MRPLIRIKHRIVASGEVFLSEMKLHCGGLWRISPVLFWIIPALSIGCGLNADHPAPTSVPRSTNGGSSGGGGTAGTGAGPTGTGSGPTTAPVSAPIVPAPGSFQPLAGCGNPNTGTPSNDWGPGSVPVYVDPVSLLVGDPVYNSNAIFWLSRETKPGQSVLMTGAFTDAAKNIRVALIPPGAMNWQALVESSGTVVPATEQSTTGLSFVVPPNFPSGVYGFEIEDPTASPVLALANLPSMAWAVGVPSTQSPEVALQHQVTDCSVEQGGTLRIFGKNFDASNHVLLQAQGGAVYELMPSKSDTNSIAVEIPSALAPGVYNLWIGGSPWSWTSSSASQITIYAPLTYSVTRVTCPALVGDGQKDNTGALQACLDRNGPEPGSKQLVYIMLPPGNFVLTGGVKARSYEVLQGSSPTATRLIGEPRGAPPAAWIAAPPYFGIANLSMQAPANPHLLAVQDTTGNPQRSGHLFFENVNFQSTSDASNGSEMMFLLAGPDIQVYNSFFLSDSNQAFDVNFGDGAAVSGNQFVLNNWTGLGFSDSQNIVFENNLTYSQNTPGQGVNGFSGGSGLSISRGNSQFGPSAVSQDVYVGYNRFQNMGSKGQQVITNDGDGGSYFGRIASSTASTVVLSDDPAWNWMGTTNPEASSVAIISGTGVGQYSLMKSYSGRNINLVSPWKVPPDSSSVLVITQYELNMTIAHNTISNTLGVAIVLGDALEGVIEDNALTNSGDGILVSAYGPYGGPAAYGPVINSDVLRNTIATGAGTFVTPSVNTNLGGIGIQDMPGCLVSGLMIRDNTVPPSQTIFSVDGMNGISAAVIEQNQANWLPTFPIPGFLVQDNVPQ